MIDLKNDLKNLGVSLAITFLMLQVLFFKTPISTTVMAALALYWLLIVPGFWLTYLYPDLPFMERLALSIPISAVLVGIPAYYLGLSGIHVAYSAKLLPPIFAAVSIVIIKKIKSD